MLHRFKSSIIRLFRQCVCVLKGDRTTGNEIVPVADQNYEIWNGTIFVLWTFGVKSILCTCIYLYLTTDFCKKNNYQLTDGNIYDYLNFVIWKLFCSSYKCRLIVSRKTTLSRIHKVIMIKLIFYITTDIYVHVLYIELILIHLFEFNMEFVSRVRQGFWYSHEWKY